MDLAASSQRCFRRKLLSGLLYQHRVMCGQLRTFPQRDVKEVATMIVSVNCQSEALPLSLASIHRAAEKGYSRKFACSRSHRYTEVGTKADSPGPIGP